MGAKFLQPDERNISEVFSGLYTIPVYQRPYSWEKEQVEQLLIDFNEAYNNYCAANTNNISNQKDEFAFFAGTIFIQNIANIKGQYPKYLVVDGQQRITTITLIIMVLLYQLRKKQSKDDVVHELENSLWKKIDRKINKAYRVLELGNVDKEIMKTLFDDLFSKDDIIKNVKIKKEANANAVEANLIDNLLYINEYFSEFDETKLCDYYEYIKIHVRFITIEVFTDLPTMFNIFESINSKGKPLQDLDLIKSYIFQNIPNDDYEQYLHMWGDLITQTNDNLMDYITVYVRANITYYVYGIKYSVFKSLAENKLKDYYNVSTIGDVLKAFVKDLSKNVKFYKMLSNITELENISNISKKVCSYFMMNELSAYQHTRAIYFRLLVMYVNKEIDIKTFERIVEFAFKFIVTFQSVSSRESKNTIKTFILAQSEIYGKDTIDAKLGNKIMAVFTRAIKDNAITTDSLRASIKNSLAYDTNKKVLKVILSYLEAIDKQGHMQYDKLLSLLQADNSLQLDHIMPQDPNKNDNNFYYYVDEDKAYLKSGHDFDVDKKAKEMPKEDFYHTYLHVIGNMRLKWGTGNKIKSNKVELNDAGEKFNLNGQIAKRTVTITNKILKSNILLNGDTIPPMKILENNEQLIINKFENIAYKDYTPISYEFLESEAVLDSFKYSNLLYRVLASFYDLEKDKIVDLAKKNYAPMQSNRIYMSTQENVLVRPYRIDDNVYVETNLSSDYIIKLIYLLIREIGLNETDIKITLKRR